MNEAPEFGRYEKTEKAPVTKYATASAVLGALALVFSITQLALVFALPSLACAFVSRGKNGAFSSSDRAGLVLSAVAIFLSLLAAVLVALFSGAVAEYMKNAIIGSSAFSATTFSRIA